jgi:GrpB-like predicted nucleotidyltransferase (UPF0157 family)
MSTVRFLPSDRFARQASEAFAVHARRIRERLPGVDVTHVGGTSVAGLLTTGDVDLHVRVEPADFPAARSALCELYEPLYPDRWRESAYFFDPDSDPRVEVALTETGNIDDLHHGEAWRRIANDPQLIDRYNALKRQYEGQPLDGYQAAKREFFYDNFRL